MQKLTFTQAIDGYLIHLSARRVSPHTILDYQNTFRKFVAFHGDKPIAGITHHDIESFLNSFDPAKFKKKTLLNYHTGLSALWTWALSENLVKTHVVRQVTPPDPPKNEIVPFTEKDVRLMLSSLDHSRVYSRHNGQPTSHSLPNVLRNRAIILVLLDTGLRANELSLLTMADADLKNLRLVNIQGKGDKKRTAQICPKTAKAIWRYLATRSDTRPKDPLFAARDEIAHFTRGGLLQLIKRIGNRAEVPNAHPHRFRHTFAVNYLRNGGDIYTLQAILGHSSLEMVKHYLHLAQIDTENAHRRASPVANWNL